LIIHIKSLSFQAILGILDFERITPQEVIINTNIVYTYHDTFINYADVAAFIEKEMQTQKFELIEEALQALSEGIKTLFPAVQKVTLEIIKPNIMPNCRVSVEETYTF